MEEGQRRVGVCIHTQKKVVQEWVNGGWLCLHTDTEEQDEINVREFEIKKNKKVA